VVEQDETEAHHNKKNHMPEKTDSDRQHEARQTVLQNRADAQERNSYYDSPSWRDNDSRDTSDDHEPGKDEG
jgi:hypothetical protein